MDLTPNKLPNQQSSSGDGRSGDGRSGDALGRGMEFAIIVFAFLGLGFVIDRWLGTKPVFMIVFVVLGLIGQFASMWYGYDARMKQLEQERLDLTRTGRDVRRGMGSST